MFVAVEQEAGGVHTGVVPAGCKNNLCGREEYGSVLVLLAVTAAIP